MHVKGWETSFRRGWLGVSITWPPSCSPSQNFQPSPAYGSGMGWRAIDCNVANILEFTTCQIRVKRKALKFPKIHVTLSSRCHLFDLHFTSVSYVSSHSQILKPQNFQRTDFALSHQFSALHRRLPQHKDMMACGGILGREVWTSVSGCQQDLLNTVV